MLLSKGRFARCFEAQLLVQEVTQVFRYLLKPERLVAGELVEVNSGGHVLFCFFAPPERMHFAPERVLITKFHNSRLTTQSEQFANELTRHLGICAPSCRILRQQASSSLLEGWSGGTKTSQLCSQGTSHSRKFIQSCGAVSEAVQWDI